MSDFWRREPHRGPRSAHGGIQARSQRGDIGESWWSQRFIAILEALDYGSRLERGRHYARRGQVLDLELRPGVVEASVQGSRARPYRVRLTVQVLSERDWDRAERAMAAKALFMAKLLSGEMPQEIEEAFAACQLTLFPASAQELASSCSCPDLASPCKHAAAVFYLLAEAFDRDPFLVFAWRGRAREELVEHLRALRGDGGAGQAATTDPADAPLDACLDRYWSAGPQLEEVQVRPWSAEMPDALVRQLGPVGITVRGRDVVEALADAYRAMSAGAHRRALGDDPSSGAARPPGGVRS